DDKSFIFSVDLFDEYLVLAEKVELEDEKVILKFVDRFGKEVWRSNPGYFGIVNPISAREFINVPYIAGGTISKFQFYRGN
ncbi:hypothetical protein, partial [Klebsiella pneumoniae]|uniref:hypothetical protein n=1 Tax=Klebsiella pneumoniae TaxID=573 RepID=UPI0027316389